jgi:hypothetical protein
VGKFPADLGEFRKVITAVHFAVRALLDVTLPNQVWASRRQAQDDPKRDI